MEWACLIKMLDSKWAMAIFHQINLDKIKTEGLTKDNKINLFSRKKFYNF